MAWVSGMVRVAVEVAEDIEGGDGCLVVAVAGYHRHDGVCVGLLQAGDGRLALDDVGPLRLDACSLSVTRSALSGTKSLKCEAERLKVLPEMAVTRAASLQLSWAALAARQASSALRSLRRCCLAARIRSLFEQKMK